MKKTDRIRQLLDMGCLPRQIAREVPCALSLVYGVRGRREIPLLKHQIAQIRLGLSEIQDRVCALEGKPIDAFERMQARQRDS